MTILPSLDPLDPRPTTGRRPTRADQLHALLADAIIAGGLAPGTPLDETELAGRFQVSRTPVREALRRLQASGLVEIEPHRGACVARPSEERLRDMFFVMAELEALCAGQAALTMSPRERRDLDALHQRSIGQVQTGDASGYNQTNTAFHDTIYRGAHNTYLADLTRQTRSRLAPFRKAQFQTAGRLARSFAEHGRIVAAILKADRDGAIAAMRDHIGTVEQAWESLARESE
jgi:DNA-binding GntR family transcriptional regulator